MLIACGGAPEQGSPWAEDIDAHATPILGGYTDSEDTAVVGTIHFQGNSVSACSGSLIAPNVVLTALHCVSQTPAQVTCMESQGQLYPASSFGVTTKTSLTQNPSDYVGVDSVSVPPGNEFCGRDVAILVLSQSIPASAALPIVPRVEDKALVNEIYSAVGYGQQGDGGPSGTRQRIDNRAILCTGINCGDSSSIKATEWVGTGNVCQGDSGGPALDSAGLVIGVASRGGAGCAETAYGDVASHAVWIKDTTIAATTQAGLTPPSWASGEMSGVGGGASVAASSASTGGGGTIVGSGAGESDLWIAGNAEQTDIDGAIVSSCSLGHPAERAPRWLLLLPLFGVLVRRRVGRELGFCRVRRQVTGRWAGTPPDRQWRPGERSRHRTKPGSCWLERHRG